METTKEQKALAAALKRLEVAESKRLSAFQKWKEIDDKRKTLKPYPLCCPLSVEAWSDLQKAESYLSRVKGQFNRRFPTA